VRITRSAVGVIRQRRARRCPFNYYSQSLPCLRHQHLRIFGARYSILRAHFYKDYVRREQIKLGMATILVVLVFSEFDFLYFFLQSTGLAWRPHFSSASHISH